MHHHKLVRYIQCTYLFSYPFSFWNFIINFLNRLLSKYFFHSLFAIHERHITTHSVFSVVIGVVTRFLHIKHTSLFLSIFHSFLYMVFTNGTTIYDISRSISLIFFMKFKIAKDTICFTHYLLLLISLLAMNQTYQLTHLNN